MRRQVFLCLETFIPELISKRHGIHWHFYTEQRNHYQSRVISALRLEIFCFLQHSVGSNLILIHFTFVDACHLRCMSLFANQLIIIAHYFNTKILIIISQDGALKTNCILHFIFFRSLFLLTLFFSSFVSRFRKKKKKTENCVCHPYSSCNNNKNNEYIRQNTNFHKKLILCLVFIQKKGEEKYNTKLSN